MTPTCRALYPPEWAAPLNLGTVLCDQPAGHAGQHLGHSPGTWDVARVFWDQDINAHEPPWCPLDVNCTLKPGHPGICMDQR